MKIKTNTNSGQICNWKSFNEIAQKITLPVNLFYDFNETNSAKNRKFSFKNVFFESLCHQYPQGLWTDIESHYYKTLLNLVDGKDKYLKSVDELNENLEVIIKYFEIYLNENINYNNIKQNRPFHQLLAYNKKFLSQKYYDVDTTNYLNEFPISEHKYIIDFDNNLEKNIYHDIDFNKNTPVTLILDFNYTKTVSKYIERLLIEPKLYGNIDHIKIHGELNNKSNPINLGFGDEMDDKYKILEQLNDNKYLNHIKSFLYSNNSNYRILLNWINTNKYQVHLMGHSCGLSDRIMLNTIFEHPNCKSIKLHYYEWENNGITKDDFKEKVQNISRHFNKKSLMRDKIVDKSLCKPLSI